VVFVVVNTSPKAVVRLETYSEGSMAMSLTLHTIEVVPKDAEDGQIEQPMPNDGEDGTCTCWHKKQD
tara:strand:+ start:344 stop:544 length:201 start_codon:yes stop_codon:yes gene_type:complete